MPSERAEQIHAGLERLMRACDDGRLDEAFTTARVQAAFAHGSAVDPTVDEPHDLDVAIWCGGDGPADLLALIDELSRVTGVDVDLSVLDHAPVSLVARASTARALWEAQPGEVARLQMRFVPQEWDTAWLRRRRLEQLAGR